MLFLLGTCFAFHDLLLPFLITRIVIPAFGRPVASEAVLHRPFSHWQAEAALQDGEDDEEAEEKTKSTR